MPARHFGWEDFRHNRLELDCKIIDIVPNDPAQTSYTGSGRIYQDADGGLLLKCYSESTMGAGVGDTLNRLSRAKAGKLLPRGDLFTVRALSFQGLVWKCNEVSISPVHFAPTSSDIVTARLPKLTTTRTHSGGTGSFLRFLFTHQRADDWSGLTGEWEIGAPYTGYRLRVLELNNREILVALSTPGSFPAGLEVRVLEAIRYVLGRPLHVSLLEQGAVARLETTLYPPGRNVRTIPWPPLETKGTPQGPDLVRLFERYLTFASTHPVEEQVHPCSMQLAHAHEASASFTEAWAVGLCVAFEGIANLVPFTPSEETDSVVAQIQKVAGRLLKRHNIEEVLQNRVIGLLSQLSQTRVLDRLRSLVEAGYIREEEVRTWTKLRNARVHTAKFGADDLSDYRVQQMFDAIFSVYTTLNKITFHLIGYEGHYIDYSSEGFPIRRYPDRGNPARVT
jgi:hypothetical protein